MISNRPDLNLNGSGKENLLERKLEEIAATESAVYALMANYPHPRDYLMPGFYIMDAKEIQDKRLTLLRELLTELKAEAEYIADGGPK